MERADSLDCWLYERPTGDLREVGPVDDHQFEGALPRGR
jgi:hypothetical protein